MRGNISAHLSVVGNLIGEATVDVAPKDRRPTHHHVGQAGRPRAPRAGHRQDRGSRNRRAGPAGRGLAPSRAKRRSASAKRTSILRSPTSSARATCIGRQLLPKQTLDDAEARYTSAVAQVDLAAGPARTVRRRGCRSCGSISPTPTSCRRSTASSRKRNVDPGAWVSQQAPLVSVVDISSLRLVANVVEKDLRLVSVGDPALVEVDAFPARSSTAGSRASRPSSIRRRAPRRWKSKFPIRDFRLKPGMYAKVNLEIEDRENVLLVPKIALVDSEGQRGVYQPSDDSRPHFKAVKVGHRRRRARRDPRRPQRRRDHRLGGRRRPAPQRSTARRRGRPAVSGAAPGGRGGPRRAAPGNGRAGRRGHRAGPGGPSSGQAPERSARPRTARSPQSASGRWLSERS